MAIIHQLSTENSSMCYECNSPKHLS